MTVFRHNWLRQRAGSGGLTKTMRTFVYLTLARVFFKGRSRRDWLSQGSCGYLRRSSQRALIIASICGVLVARFTRFLFIGYPFYCLGEDEALVSQMIKFAERLPPEWQSKWEEMRENSKRDRKGQEDREPTQLEERFAEAVNDSTLDPLLPIIRGLMRFLPSSRITADEALDLLGEIEEEWPEGEWVEEEWAEEETEEYAEEQEKLSVDTETFPDCKVVGIVDCR